MSNSYKTLARIFHADQSTDAYANHHLLAKQRLEADSTYRTAIITPLGELFVGMPREITSQLTRILLAERKVSRLWNGISSVMRRNYIFHFVSEELMATNEMEGVRSTRKEVEVAIEAANQARKSNSGQTARFSKFANLYLNITDQKAEPPQTLEDIRAIYDQIALGEISEKDKPDGELFRKEDVEIQGPHGTAIHSGVSGEARINVLLTEMIKLVSSDLMPSILSAIVSHFLFEYIHPFYDGNGRTGRYLLALYLSRDMTMPTVLSLSRVISESKNSYYKAFTEAEDKLNCGELTFFVNTMLELIARAQHELIDELGVKLDQYAKACNLRDQLADEKGLSQHAGQLLHCIMQEELFGITKTVTLSALHEQLNLSTQTVRKYAGDLEDAELVTRASQRPLSFRASKQLLSYMGME